MSEMNGFLKELAENKDKMKQLYEQVMTAVPSISKQYKSPEFMHRLETSGDSYYEEVDHAINAMLENYINLRVADGVEGIDDADSIYILLDLFMFVVQSLISNGDGKLTVDDGIFLYTLQVAILGAANDSMQKSLENFIVNSFQPVEGNPNPADIIEFPGKHLKQ